MLGSWSHSIPLEGEPARAFYRRRVYVQLRATAILSLVFVVGHALSTHHELREPAVLGELAVGALLFALAFVVKRTEEQRVVEVVDALAIFVVTTGFAVAVMHRDRASRPEQFILLVSMAAQATRAALIPSSGPRTLIIGAVATTPVAVLTFAHFGVDAPEGVVARGLHVSLWCALSVGISTLISQRIYGLTKRVEEARKLGQYTLDEKIGEGGMGEVYRASHAMLRRPTAVKLLPSSRSSEMDILRFEREVQLTSRLTNPSTIQIYDFGRAADGTFYYAMEYLDGLTLDELVRSHGAQPAGRVARILADVCASLAEAHEAGLVHRDIKPQNIMLCARGGVLDVVKVLDFGLVRSTEMSTDPERTAATQVVGTPMYMAPEAVSSPDRVDGRADLYAVGAVAYFLLVGAPVFRADSAIAILAKHLHEAPEPFSVRTPRSVPPRLEQLVLTCLAKKPEDRPESARALRKELLAIATEVDVGIDLEEFWKDHERQELALAPTESITMTIMPQMLTRASP